MMSNKDIFDGINENNQKSIKKILLIDMVENHLRKLINKLKK